MANLHYAFAPHARFSGQWHTDVLLGWDANGTLQSIQPQITADQLAAVPYQKLYGAVIAGMPNLHSHAFQSAMAGLTEYRHQSQDSFWSWRDLMYRFAAKLRPEDIAHIARWLYIDMLKAGYTSVCEFHYTHHQPNGQPYDSLSELSIQICQAAQHSGIGLTLLPVLYQYSNFGEQAPRADQGRFLNQPDALIRLLEETRQHYPESAQLRYGVAPHSLRAVSASSLQEITKELHQRFTNAPIHIHIAEQMAEVEASLAHTGLRPVEWLLENLEVNHHWCLIHATHLTQNEMLQLAQSQAVAGLCLTTEANLGDGFFPINDYLAAKGVIGVGSDSHISVDWRSELRLLEYGQRLQQQQRNVLSDPAQPYVADHLFDASLRGGAQATGRPVGELAIGKQADFMVLDLDNPILAEHNPDTWLSSLVFNERNHHQPIRDVFVAGQQRIFEGKHPDEAQAFSQYRATLNYLLNH